MIPAEPSPCRPHAGVDHQRCRSARRWSRLRMPFKSECQRGTSRLIPSERHTSSPGDLLKEAGPGHFVVGHVVTSLLVVVTCRGKWVVESQYFTGIVTSGVPGPVSIAAGAEFGRRAEMTIQEKRLFLEPDFDNTENWNHECLDCPTYDGRGRDATTPSKTK
jgi:hypothetical protein